MYTVARYARNSVAVIKILYFLMFAALASWSTYFYVFLEDERSLTGVQIGLIAAVQQITNIVFLPLWGMISDRYGKRSVFLLLLGISIVLLYGFFVQGTFIYYFLLMILFSALYNPIGAIFDTFAITKSREKLVRTTYGEMRLWASMGWAVASLTTGFFVEKSSSLSIIFIIASCVLAVTWIVSFLYLNKKREVRSNQAPSFTTLKTVLFNNKKLFYFFILIMVYYILNSPTLMFINLYYKEIGASNTQIGIAFAVQSVFELPFMFYGARILNRFGIRRVIMATMIVAAFRMLLYGLTSNPWIAIAIGTTHGITLGLFIVAVIEYTHHIVHPSQNSTGQTLMYTFLGIGTSVGNFVNGVLKDTIGLQHAMKLDAALVILLVIGTYLFLFFRKNKEKLQVKPNSDTTLYH